MRKFKILRRSLRRHKLAKTRQLRKLFWQCGFIDKKRKEIIGYDESAIQRCIWNSRPIMFEKCNSRFY